MNLEGVDIFQAETIRRAAKIPAELRYRVEVRLLRRRRQIADRHVLDHAAAKRADLSHRKTSCLQGWASFNPQNRICKEVALQRPKTGKFDYLSAPNHPAHSMAFKFFTDDSPGEMQIAHGLL